MLNHREAVADINVSRKWLPAGYRFEAWNGGLLRGTLRYTDKDSVALNCSFSGTTISFFVIE